MADSSSLMASCLAILACRIATAWGLAKSARLDGFEVAIFGSFKYLVIIFRSS
jgi:hypothetical protein